MRTVEYLILQRNGLITLPNSWKRAMNLKDGENVLLIFDRDKKAVTMIKSSWIWNIEADLIRANDKLLELDDFLFKKKQTTPE